jgi:Flp pilus assembly protein TadD
MDEFRRTIALDPKYMDPHHALGVTMRDKGQLDEAMAEFRRAITLDPKYAGAHYHLGLALRDKGQLDEAMLSHLVAGDRRLSPGLLLAEMYLRILRAAQR